MGGFHLLGRRPDENRVTIEALLSCRPGLGIPVARTSGPRGALLQERRRRTATGSWGRSLARFERRVRFALAAFPILALSGSPAVAHGPCGARHHGCPGCRPAGERHHCCPGSVSRSAGAPDVAPGDRGPGGSTYDLDTVTTLRGTVRAVTVVPARGGCVGGTHVTLEGEGAVTEVHLGPTWFLERESVELSKGDSLDVTGSVVDSRGATVLVAREIKKGAKVFQLRDERGLPLWGGGAGRQ